MTDALPHNLEIEQALLGALLHKNELYESVGEIADTAHFFDPLHARIFEAIKTLVQKGSLASPITLAPFFESDPTLEKDKAKSYLISLGQNVLSFAGVTDYAKQLKDLYLRRQLVDLSDTLKQQAQKPSLESTAEDHIESAENILFKLSETGKNAHNFSSLSQALTEAIQTSEKAFQRDSHVVGVTTGLKDLDKPLGGLHPSDLVIVAARPSMGKTSLITNMAFNAAKKYLDSNGTDGASVAFFSLEMSAEQIAMRLLGQESGIASDRIRRGSISQEDFPTFIKVSDTLSQIPFYIDDTPGLTVSALRTRARRLARKKGLGLIIVDYLQLLSGGTNNPENRVQELSAITRQLKHLAKELAVPVIAASQLSRSVEQREDKRPMLSDLRESGSIEQDADVVMFIYREEYYTGRQKPAEGSDKMAAWKETMEKVYNRAEVMIAKQRHGPISNVPLHFNGMLTKFSDLATDYPKAA